VPYPIVAFYFILVTLAVITIFSLVNKRLNRHMPQEPKRIRYRPQIIR